MAGATYNRPTHIVFDAETGDTSEIPYTDEQIAEQQAARSAFESEQIALAAAKSAAEAKLAKLGLTAEDLKALLG